MEKTCPFCAEPIRDEALRCPHCRSRLRTFNTEGWQRDQPDALLAGVCAALSRTFAIPVALTRIAFVVLALAHAVGAIAYLALWLLIPKHAGEPSLLEHFLVRAQDVVHRVATGKMWPEEHRGERGSTDVAGSPRNGA
jgi:phage shock protein PspC (stress-responsive transcriptional regulator)